MYNIHRRNFTLRGGAPCTPLASIPLKEGRNMEHTIGFPNLGLEFTLNRVACTVLGKDIYWYGIIICAGFILAALYVNSRTKDFGITSDNLTDCLIICVPLGIICARIYYVVFEWGYYAQHPGEIIAIWKGGIAIYGGIIGTLIGLFVYSRVKKLSLASLCDLAAFGLLIGQCIGRWGNFVNGEAHGGPTTLPWGMTIDGQSMVHPTTGTSPASSCCISIRKNAGSRARSRCSMPHGTAPAAHGSRACARTACISARSASRSSSLSSAVSRRSRCSRGSITGLR